MNKDKIKQFPEKAGYGHIILAYNVFIQLNDLYAQFPKHKISQDEFMDITQAVWKNVKRDLKIKV